MIRIEDVLKLHEDTVALWHIEPISNPYTDALQLVCKQHSFNFQLWHEEDIARSRDVSDAKIAEVKRNIDGFNQQRNDHIEKVDDWITGWLIAEGYEAESETPINSETPGSIIDRLSILSLRLYHLHEQTERDDVDQAHRDSVKRKISICYEQRTDLSTSLKMLLEDIQAGRKRHKTYRQCKMYNDPALNPYLYAKGLKKAG
jgi:hypothetical protein